MGKSNVHNPRRLNFKFSQYFKKLKVILLLSFEITSSNMHMYIYFKMGALCRKAVELKEGCRVVHNPLNFCPIVYCL